MPRQPRPVLSINIPLAQSFTVSSLPSTAGLMEDNLQTDSGDDTDSGSESDSPVPLLLPLAQLPRVQGLARSRTLGSVITPSEIVGRPKTQPLQRSNSAHIRRSSKPKPYDISHRPGFANVVTMGKTIYTPWGLPMPATPAILPRPGQPLINKISGSRRSQPEPQSSSRSTIPSADSPRTLKRHNAIRLPRNHGRKDYLPSSRPVKETTRNPEPEPIPYLRSPFQPCSTPPNQPNSEECPTEPNTPISPIFSVASDASSQTSIGSPPSIVSEKAATGYFDRRP